MLEGTISLVVKQWHGSKTYVDTVRSLTRNNRNTRLKNKKEVHAFERKYKIQNKTKESF